MSRDAGGLRYVNLNSSGASSDDDTALFIYSPSVSPNSEHGQDSNERSNLNRFLNSCTFRFCCIVGSLSIFYLGIAEIAMGISSDTTISLDVIGNSTLYNSMLGNSTLLPPSSGLGM